MIVAGLDLSLVKTGLCILNEKEVLFLDEIRPEIVDESSKRKKKIQLKGMERILYTTDLIMNLLDYHMVDYVGMENFSFTPHSSATHPIAMQGGIVRYRLIDKKIPYQTFSPQTLKKFICGHLDLPKRQKGLPLKELNTQRKASKQLMIDQVKNTLKWNDEKKIMTDNMADAFGLALLKFGIEVCKKENKIISWEDCFGQHVKMNHNQCDIIEKWWKVNTDIKRVEPKSII